ncbi:short chain dehydrogenase [Hortaea werneckii]|nr:short chain dehydrogenase [Hortaea werneckii]
MLPRTPYRHHITPPWTARRKRLELPREETARSTPGKKSWWDSGRIDLHVDANRVIFTARGSAVTAINTQVRASNPVAARSEQEDCWGLEVLGGTETAEQSTSHPGLLQVRVDLQQAVGHGGSDVARAEGVDADAVGADLLGHGAAHLVHSCLGSGAVQASVGDLAGHGGDEDDGALSAVVDEVAGGVLGRDESARHVDIHHLLEVLDRVVDSHLLLLDTGAGDKTGQGCVMGLAVLGDFFIEPGDLLLARDVAAVVGEGDAGSLGQLLQDRPVAGGRLLQHIQTGCVAACFNYSASQRET